MFYSSACRLLIHLWPDRWVATAGPRPGLRVVCCGRDPLCRSNIVDAVAPAPLHLVGRLLLWPFALLDWAVTLPAALPRVLIGVWRLPYFTLPWPPIF